MKKILCCGLIILSFMLILPLSVMKKPEAEAAATSANAVSPKKEVSDTGIFRISDSKTGAVTEMKANEYIFGVLAAEMPALYNDEALPVIGARKTRTRSTILLQILTPTKALLPRKRRARNGATRRTNTAISLKTR